MPTKYKLHKRTKIGNLKFLVQKIAPYLLYPRLGKNRPEFSGDSRILFLPVMTNYLVVYTIIENDLHIVRVLTKYQNICAIL